MNYRRLGRSGLLLSELSLGLWHNFGTDDSFSEASAMVKEAYNKGITVFDLANNYGPPPGSAETNFGRILQKELKGERNKIVITSKAGYTMWEGPYGDWGSRKYLVASCDESLARMGIDYVDIFYHHRYDPNTPLEETMGALDFIVRSGRALYVGLSNYPADKLREAKAILNTLGTPCVVDQLKYSLLVRKPEAEHFAAHKEIGMGCVSFSPLAQGQLTDRYVNGIPKDSRAARQNSFLKLDELHSNEEKVRALAQIAAERGETLARMAISWQLHANEINGEGANRVTSVIIGTSKVSQLAENLLALDSPAFSAAEIEAINKITL